MAFNKAMINEIRAAAEAVDAVTKKMIADPKIGQEMSAIAFRNYLASAARDIGDAYIRSAGNALLAEMLKQANVPQVIRDAFDL
jgi:hypothetical protein